jgi:hypothetical protein
VDRDALRSGRIEADHSVSRKTGVGKQYLESIPLFASEEHIAAAVLGGDRLQEWRQMAPLLEQKGLPKTPPQKAGGPRHGHPRRYDAGDSAIPNNKAKGHGALSVASMAEGVLLRHDKYPTS